jgi:hypothetical protein
MRRPLLQVAATDGRDGRKAAAVPLELPERKDVSHGSSHHTPASRAVLLLSCRRAADLDAANGTGRRPSLQRMLMPPYPQLRSLSSVLSAWLLGGSQGAQVQWLADVLADVTAAGSMAQLVTALTSAVAQEAARHMLGVAAAAPPSVQLALVVPPCGGSQTGTALLLSPSIMQELPAWLVVTSSQALAKPFGLAARPMNTRHAVLCSPVPAPQETSALSVASFTPPPSGGTQEAANKPQLDLSYVAASSPLIQSFDHSFGGGRPSSTGGTAPHAMPVGKLASRKALVFRLGPPSEQASSAGGGSSHLVASSRASSVAGAPGRQLPPVSSSRMRPFSGTAHVPTMPPERRVGPGEAAAAADGQAAAAGLRAQPFSLAHTLLGAALAEEAGSRGSAAAVRDTRARGLSDVRPPQRRVVQDTVVHLQVSW